MAGQIEALPIRRVASRFIARNEQDGLDELDRAVAAVHASINRGYIAFTALFTVFLLTFAVCAIIAVVIAYAYPKISNAFMAADFVAGIGLIATLGYWRFRQYGFGTPTKPRAAHYTGVSKDTAANLEKFFQIMQRETTPRAFCYTKAGVRKQLDRRHFFGAFRILMLSEYRPVREPMFSPHGLWFSHEVFIEADVEAMIEAAKVKPKVTGRPKIYDYTDAVMSLIGHPEITELTIGVRGNQQKIIDLLANWYDSKNQTPPSDGQLRNYAKMILEQIAKNRTA